MSIKAINSVNTVKYNQNNRDKNNQPSFKGSFNPVVTVMDAIERGGFIAGFLAQDGLGMVVPRIYEGLNRNRPKDENGKKTGPLNWEFARREGIREILSGPSAYFIPLGILTILKKTSGTANNVHVSHINVLGNNFATYAAKNPEQLQNAVEFKKGYYAQVFENALSNSTDKNLQGEELKQTAQKLADKLVESETKRANKDKKGAKKLLAEITEEFRQIRKSTTAASSNEFAAILEIEGKDKKLGTSISRLVQSMTDYSQDALDKVNKHLKKNASANIDDYIKKFNLHRSGTRVLANLGMWGAVVGFYTLIPKLYNMGLKGDPGLKGLENSQPENKEQNGKNVSFQGGFATKVGKTVVENEKIGNFLNKFEFNGASMPITAMLTLLFGFCLPPRYINAKSDKERKEILVRDISSFTAILFGAKALSRGFSNVLAKTSGLALNIKPEDHSKGVLHKVKNYLTAGEGINVLSSDQIVSKYSNIDQYKDGIHGFFDFLEENGGNVKKVLNIDNVVKENAEAIMKDFNGKSIKDATVKEIREAFTKAKGSEALEKIYSVFSSADNKFIGRAKTLNSLFGFVSMLVLVPVFMIWLARYCEKMTKKAVAKEQEQQVSAKETAPQNPVPSIVSNQPSMSGFLKK